MEPIHQSIQIFYYLIIIRHLARPDFIAREIPRFVDAAGTAEEAKIVRTSVDDVEPFC